MDLDISSGWHFIEGMEGRKKRPVVMYYIPEDPILTNKIAGFDLVNTLIWTDRGDYTIRGAEKWVWRSDEIPKFLCSLMKFQGKPEEDDRWTVVVFSNYITKGFDELQSRVEQMFADVQEACGEPVTFFFFASLGSQTYDKPSVAMWDLFKSIWEGLTDEPLTPDESSFFIGDRAGGFVESDDPMFKKGGVEVSDQELAEYQLAPGTPVGDDSLFALRAGLNFLLPSELPPQQEPDFPQVGHQEMIIMVGQQGSGKTTWATRLSEDLGYSLVASEPTPGDNTFVIKDKKRRLRMIDQLLTEGKSIIVDATHPTRASRAELIQIAQQHNVPVRIFWVARPGRPYNELREKPVSEIALRTYTKNFERPSPEEGAEVVRLS